MSKFKHIWSYPTLTEAIGYVWKHPYYKGQANIKLVKNSIIIHKVITVVLVVTSLVLVIDSNHRTWMHNK